MFYGCQTFRLYKRGEAGICCDVDGLSLGPVRLVERAGKAYFVRPAEDIILALEAAYGPLGQAVADDLAQKIVGIARSLNGGELTHAMLKTLYLRLPEIPAENFAKMNGVVRGKVDPRKKVMTAAERVAAENAARDLAVGLSKALLQSLPKSDKIVMEKYNPNLDERGRFSSGQGGATNNANRATDASGGLWLRRRIPIKCQWILVKIWERMWQTLSQNRRPLWLIYKLFTMRIGQLK
jgi:hypothetical protein